MGEMVRGENVAVGNLILRDFGHKFFPKHLSWKYWMLPDFGTQMELAFCSKITE